MNILISRHTYTKIHAHARARADVFLCLQIRILVFSLYIHTRARASECSCLLMCIFVTDTLQTSFLSSSLRVYALLSGSLLRTSSESGSNLLFASSSLPSKRQRHTITSSEIVIAIDFTHLSARSTWPGMMCLSHGSNRSVMLTSFHSAVDPAHADLIRQRQFSYAASAFYSASCILVLTFWNALQFE